MWNPWRGCKRYSEGCKFCYIHKGDLKRNINTGNIVKTKDFDKPISRLKNGEYKVKPGIVYTCFSTDFFIEEADQWRDDCWKIMKERKDLTFLFLTKRILRFYDVIPDNWGSGYENVVVCCTVENQETANERLAKFKEMPIAHKCITIQPMLESITIKNYLDTIELVVVGGESDINARPLNYEWVLKIRDECIEKNVDFEFRQCGTHFINDGKAYTLKTCDLMKQARAANINYKAKKPQS